MPAGNANSARETTDARRHARRTFQPSDACRPAAPAPRQQQRRPAGRHQERRRTRSTDLGEERIADMDRNGITVQVLSKAGAHMGPSADAVRGQRGDRLVRAQFNDAFAKKIAERPDRFAAFAHLAASIPEAAADELERTVTEYGFKGALISGMIRGHVPRRSQVRAAIGARGKARRAALHPSRHAARRGAQGVLRRAFRRRSISRSRPLPGAGTTRPRCTSCGSPCRARIRQISAAQRHHRPYGRGLAGHAGALRARILHRPFVSVAAAVQDHHRSGLYYVGGLFHQPAVRGRAFEPSASTG